MSVTIEPSDPYLAIEVEYVDEDGKVATNRTVVRDVADVSLTFRFDLSDLDQQKRRR